MMKKILGLLVLTACSCGAIAHEMPSPEEMEAVHACISKAGIEMPTPGQGKPPKKLSDDQKQIVDNCFKENGVEPPPKPRMKE